VRATLTYAAGDVRVEDVAAPKVHQPTDAVVRVLLSCVRGGDLWPYRSLPPTDTPRHMGHEFLGVVEETGSEVRTVTAGDVVRNITLTVGLEDVADGYRAMNDREALEVLVRP